MKHQLFFSSVESSIHAETSLPEGHVLEDGLCKGLAQQPGLSLAVLADPGQVFGEVDQELVVGSRDAGRLQNPPKVLPTLLHSLALYKTKAANMRFLHSPICFVSCVLLRHTLCSFINMK